MKFLLQGRMLKIALCYLLSVTLTLRPRAMFFWSLTSPPPFHADMKQPIGCYQQFAATFYPEECVAHESATLPVIVHHCSRSPNSGFIALQRKRDASFGLNDTLLQGTAIYRLRVVGPGGVWLLEPSYDHPSLACASYFLPVPGYYSVEVLMVYYSFSFAQPTATKPVAQPWVGHLTLQNSPQRLRHGMNGMQEDQNDAAEGPMHWATWSSAPDPTILSEQVDAAHSTGSSFHQGEADDEVNKKWSLKYWKHGETEQQFHQLHSDESDSSLLPLCPGTGPRPGRWMFHEWPRPEATPLLRTCLWGNLSDDSCSCDTPQQRALRSNLNPGTLYWQPDGCRMQSVKGLQGQGEHQAESVDDNNSSVITKEHCFLQGRRVCFIGDSHMRYLHNGLSSFLQDYKVLVHNNLKDVLQFGSLSYIAAVWGMDWPKPQGDFDTLVALNCTDVIANFGHWYASFHCGPSPRTVDDYRNALLHVRQRLLDLRNAHGMRVFWVTTSSTWLKARYEMAGIDWRTDPVLLLFNRLASDIMAGAQIVEQFISQLNGKNISRADENDSTIPIIDTWSPTHILAPELSHDGTHFLNLSPIGALQVQLLLQALCTEQMG
ncbi:hypothetical protein VOLCADRAFT_101400 [Volvox carteri f. nagariensis]|uniref:Uncharacterized protein n=1 Tax=Volvox carteri f. nagariensis TaxID=3068 RepID=D8UMJ7_VOLCA|nr:uncharacterized protein VOLCADRAFT_101400 [Volvox carteri f. nagariensis]EFJ39052.1 hypothetical protein VOLCADRAFT_101400 [Volvox carteri f. nagariensis]|eukprot:XP_002959883.1 hypothetical protein VOLCADRAFT_101400 [Volvox carteri f. nagariensis]